MAREDHIHLLIQVPPVLALSKAIATIKANSSKWAGEEGQKFAWQQGYGAFSVSASVIPVVARYIQNQEAHHKRMDFEAEFAALLEKHGIEFDRNMSLVRRGTVLPHLRCSSLLLLVHPALTGWANA